MTAPLNAPRLSRRAGWVVLGAALGVFGSFFSYRLFHHREATPALRGEAIARAQGCLTCHGADGRGGVANPGSNTGLIPGWDGPTVATLASNEQEIREWILDGKPTRLAKLEGPAHAAPIVPMPAYRDRLSAPELADLIVYFRAVSNFGVEMPEPVYEGWKVADRLGCFGCHGPGGSGGTPNPGSFKGHIPSWNGDEFPELVKDDAELCEWILNGYPKRLWENPVARRFLEGQIIGMPGYRRQLSSEDQTKLVAYFQWLRKGAGGAVPSGREDTHRIMGVITRAVKP